MDESELHEQAAWDRRQERKKAEQAERDQLRVDLAAEKEAHRKASAAAHHWEAVATNLREDLAAAQRTIAEQAARIGEATWIIDRSGGLMLRDWWARRDAFLASGGSTGPAAPQPAPAPDNESCGPGCAGHAAPASAQGTTAEPTETSERLRRLERDIIGVRRDLVGVNNWIEMTEPELHELRGADKALDKRVTALEAVPVCAEAMRRAKESPPQPAPVGAHAYNDAGHGDGQCRVTVERLSKNAVVACGRPRSAAVHWEGGK